MRRRRPDGDDLARDIQEHIEIETADNIGRGMTTEAARAAALRKFGNVARVTEETYSVWHWMWLERTLQDLRYAWRVLRKEPGFAAAAIVTLALGIGMNTAVFSVVNAVLLRPLPYPDADRLVWLANYNHRFKAEAVSGPDYFDWKEQAQSFEKMAGYTYGSGTVVYGSDAEQIGFASVPPEFLTITGARPWLGRLFDAGESRAMLLGHSLWARQFGSDPKVVGKAVTFNGFPFTVCGVLPESHQFVLPTEFPGLDIRDIEAYVPETMTRQSQVRGGPVAIVNLIAKLKRGVRLGQAKAEMEGIQANIARANPQGFYDLVTLRVAPMQEKVVGGSRRALMVLAAAVGFVLLIACVNIANLLLARATSRGREIAIRAAIGAGRGRMIAQLLVEGVVLAVAGGAAGLLLARLSLGAVVRLGVHAVPRLGESAIDSRVLAFTLAVSVATGIAFGLGPAISLSRTNLSHVLKQGGRTASAGRGGLSVRRLLMAGELALALVLLIGAGLMVKSFWRLNARPAGFAPESILTMKVSLSGPAYRDPRAPLTYFQQVIERLERAPGVAAMGISKVPMRGLINVEGIQFPAGQSPFTSYHLVSAGYFQAMGMRLTAGRWITGNEPVPAVMVNESFARRVFGSADPIGRRMRTPGPTPAQNATAVIVGVVADMRYSKLDAEPGLETYVPYRQAPAMRSMDVMVRTAGSPAAMAESIRKQVAGIDRTQPVYDVQTLEQALADSIAPRLFNLLLLGVFAATALVLAVLGVYGVMGYAVEQRTHEIGVRMALGAQRREVVRMVVRQGMAVAAAGIAAGTGAALGLTRLMGSLLYEVQPGDVPTFGAVCGLLAAAAFLACCAPAARAAGVDPVVALRYE